MTKKKRASTPKAITEQVLREYHHQCAVCGRPKPHLHHIDEDPSNYEPNNLIPLCPNFHLQDVHDPTAPVDQQKMRLFRLWKNPFIFDPRFHPIWSRLRFLRGLAETRGYSWAYCCDDLQRFVKGFEKGEYYSNRIKSVLAKPIDHLIAHLRNQGQTISKEDMKKDHVRYNKEVEEFRATEIERLCVEMLRYQGWIRNNNECGVTLN
jgi:hypothetical protein